MPRSANKSVDRHSQRRVRYTLCPSVAIGRQPFFARREPRTVRRMAFVTGTALLAALVVGCSADSGTDGSAADSKPGEETVAAAAPGKYRTLPEPCRAVETSTLKDLLPGAAELTEEQQQKVYGGTASVTYDTDRRVGCGWKSEDPSSSHTLFIDFERVVSYDPAVSDDDRAREVYTKKETAAGLSSPPRPPTPRRARRTRRTRKREPRRTPGRTPGRSRRPPPPTTPPTPPRTPCPAPLPRTTAPTRRPTRAPAARTPTTAPAPRTRAFSRASSTTSATAHFWTICSPGQVPPHSTAR